MCGDGANDCGALKTADVGISLSEAESSVASPFTSHQPDISCVPKIIKEGRAALVTAVGLFKFMVLYSLLEFFSSVLLFTFDSSLSDMEFLYIDVFLIVIFAFFFGQTKAYSGPLVPKPPSSSLLSVVPLVSVFTQLLLMVTMQILSDNLVKHFSWYLYGQSQPTDASEEFYTYDNYAVYTTSQFQYIILAITFSVGAPYRQPIYKNVPFFISLITMTLISAYITVCPAEFFRQLFQFRLPPTLQFRFLVLSISIVTFIVSVMLESFATNYFLANMLSRKRKEKLFSKKYSSEVSAFFVNSSGEYLSEIQVKCYGTMKWNNVNIERLIILGVICNLLVRVLTHEEWWGILASMLCGWLSGGTAEQKLVEACDTKNLRGREKLLTRRNETRDTKNLTRPMRYDTNDKLNSIYRDAKNLLIYSRQSIMFAQNNGVLTKY